MSVVLLALVPSLVPTLAPVSASLLRVPAARLRVDPARAAVATGGPDDDACYLFDTDGG